jgi:hypothetical protein
VYHVTIMVTVPDELVESKTVEEWKESFEPYDDNNDAEEVKDYKDVAIVIGMMYFSSGDYDNGMVGTNVECEKVKDPTFDGGEYSRQDRKTGEMFH